MTLMHSNHDKLSLGSPAPAFSLEGTDGKNYSLSNFPNAKAFLIVFMCNHCPYVQEKIGELNALQEKFKDKGLILIGINSNDSLAYSEDSFKNMKRLVDNNTIQFLYLHDETQETAKAYGAVCTPDPFLFSGDSKLIFRARVSDLREAVAQYLETGKISQKEIPSMGCSIKWKY